MKKSLLSLILISSVALTSCFKSGDKNKSEPFRLDEIHYTSENKGLVLLSKFSEFEEKVANKNSFPLYIFLAGCTTCAAFEPILTEYLNNNNIMMYSMSINTFPSDNAIKKKIKYSPSVALFKEGSMVTYLDQKNDSHTKYFKDVNGFSTWFNKNIIMP